VEDLVAKLPKSRARDIAYAREVAPGCTGMSGSTDPITPLDSPPNQAVYPDQSRHYDLARDDLSPARRRPLSQHASRVDGGRSCPAHQTLFQIWIEYKEHETSLMVWNSMPLKALFEHALSWVRLEFPRQVFEYEDIILEVTNNQSGISSYLPEEGVLCDIPVERNDVVSICLPDEHPRDAPCTDGGNSRGQSFIIWFAYHESETPHVVWSQMPVAVLVQAAVGFLKANGEDITSDRVILMHKTQYMDATCECLSDHGIAPDDLIEILVSYRQGTDVNSGPHAPVSPMRGRPRTQTPPRTRYSNRNGERGDQNSEREQEKGIAKSQDKIKQTFKCPRFSGNAKDWKLWNKGFQRYLSIWDLEYVLLPGFFDKLPLSSQQVNDNKLVYFILEDATQASPLASSYLRQAPEKNGFEAYYTLHDGFVFAASTTSTLLLNELANFRFKQDETPTELIMRLEEILQDLEMLPDGASMKFNDTQCIGYLLGALRHEPDWETVASSITSSQLKGELTFRQACNELRARCETDRAYTIMDKAVKSKRKIPGLAVKLDQILDAESVETITTALVSSVSKRINQDDNANKANPGRDRPKLNCLAKGCETKTYYALCPLHYHSVISGKTSSVELINEYGTATYNVTTKLMEYPSKVPKDRLPKPKTKQ
jgi:hypothetical protein